MVINWYAKERDEILEAIKTGFEQREATIVEIIDKIAIFSFVNAMKTLDHIEGEPPSYERKKRLAEYLGYDWDKTVKDHLTKLFTGSWNPTHDHAHGHKSTLYDPEALSNPASDD
jgi:hypothetical protein